MAIALSVVQCATCNAHHPVRKHWAVGCVWQLLAADLAPSSATVLPLWLCFSRATFRLDRPEIYFLASRPRRQRMPENTQKSAETITGCRLPSPCIATIRDPCESSRGVDSSRSSRVSRCASA